ncbi:MAG: acyltransferase family protein [Anaerolineae bacterium]
MSTAVGRQATGHVTTAAQPAVTVMSRAGTRLLFVDNLRILLISLVVLVHLAITYGAPAGDWYYTEPGEVSLPVAATMLLGIVVCQAFFMGLLFFFAAYLTPGSYDRKGPVAFAADRLKRLAIPLLVYTFGIHLLTEYLSARGEGWFHGSLADFVRFGYVRPGVGPTWFVEALLIFTAVYVLWRLISRAAAPRPAVETAVPGNRTLALVALALGLACFTVRIWLPVGTWTEPVHFQLGHFPQYIALFVVGIVAYRRNWLANVTAAQARPWKWVALVLAPLFVPLALGTYFDTGSLDAAMGGLHWQSFAYSLWEQFICVAMCLTLVVWFRERLNRQNSVARAMGGSSYATYLLHPPTIVLLTWALKGVEMDLALKFLLVAPPAVALSFLIGYLVRKLPLAREVL